MPRQRAALAGRQALEADRADSHAMERHDLVAEFREHSADLSLLALGEHQLEPRGLALTADDPRSLGANLAVGEPDTLGQLGQDLGPR
jgi:hypothetical protein